MLLALGVELQTEEECASVLDLRTNASCVHDDLEPDRVPIVLRPESHTILTDTAADAIRLLVMPQLRVRDALVELLEKFAVKIDAVPVD